MAASGQPSLIAEQADGSVIQVTAADMDVDANLLLSGGASPATFERTAPAAHPPQQSMASPPETSAVPLQEAPLKEAAAPTVDASVPAVTVELQPAGSLRVFDAIGNQLWMTSGDLSSHGIDASAMSERDYETVAQIFFSSTSGSLHSNQMRSQQACGNSVQSVNMEASSRSTSTTLPLDMQRLEDGSEPTSSGSTRIRARGSTWLPRKSDRSAPYTLRRQQQRKIAEQSCHATSPRHQVTSPAAGGSGDASAEQHSLIGQLVLVRKNGRQGVPAVVRYCRQGSFKVQYSSGAFDWVLGQQLHPVQCDADPAALRSTAVAANGYANPPSPDVVNQRRDKSPNASGDSFRCPVCCERVACSQTAFIVVRLQTCRPCADRDILVVDRDADEQSRNTADAQCQCDLGERLGAHTNE